MAPVIRFLSTVLAASATLPVPVRAADNGVGSVSPAATQSPAPEEFLVLPLHVHVLRSPTLPEADCKLTDDDVRRIVGKVNGVWHAAGIHFGLVRIVREPAAGEEAFRTGREEQGAQALRPYRLLIPEGSRREAGFHVYFVHSLPVNGVYIGQNLAIVKETAALREVEGGIDEPLPRVTAHELGHALGLLHRQATTNLMASGTTGTGLSASEVARARENAAKAKGSRTAAALAREVETSTDERQAQTLRGWLTELPRGASAR